MLWNLESRWVADIDNNVLPRRHFRDYLCYWCLHLTDYKLWPCSAEYFSCSFPFAPTHDHAEGFRTCLSDIVIRLSGSAVCWFLLISAVHPNLTFPCPICPIAMLTWCVSPQSMHGEWLASCNQFLRGSRFLCSTGIPYYCCLHFQRIWKRSKNSRWNPFIGRINTTEPRDLVACWDVYAMYPSIHLLGLHSPRTLSPGVPDAVETLHDGKYQKNHKEADSEPSFCFCCTWIPGCVHLVSECR